MLGYGGACSQYLTPLVLIFFGLSHPDHIHHPFFPLFWLAFAELQSDLTPNAFSP